MLHQKMYNNKNLKIKKTTIQEETLKDGQTNNRNQILFLINHRNQSRKTLRNNKNNK